MSTLFPRRLQPLPLFISRMLRSVCLAVLMIALALVMGMCGYHYFEDMPWIDAFVNAAMILSGMGPMGILQTSGGKLFAGCYALFSGLFFIIIMGLLLAPILHRFFHRLKLEEESDGKKKK